MNLQKNMLGFFLGKKMNENDVWILDVGRTMLLTMCSRPFPSTLVELLWYADL